MLVHRKLGRLDERTIRRFLLPLDSDLALHRQLTDYFLTPSYKFGAIGVFDGPRLVNLVLFSRYGTTTFIHYTAQGTVGLEAVVQDIGYPAEMFLKDPHVPETEDWIRVLEVTPGFVVDHPAYDGVFSRVAPRFKGAVFRHS